MHYLCPLSPNPLVVEFPEPVSATKAAEHDKRYFTANSSIPRLLVDEVADDGGTCGMSNTVTPEGDKPRDTLRARINPEKRRSTVHPGHATGLTHISCRDTRDCRQSFHSRFILHIPTFATRKAVLIREETNGKTQCISAVCGGRDGGGD
jgi:hypothetical protein